MASRVVPLFPLKVVLFPGMVLPLNIFEPRYRTMIRRCLDEHQLFGVVLIREGEEVGEPAVPFETGTLAAIQEVTQLDDGRLELVTVGVSRFRLLEEVAGEPYAQGRVEVLDDAAEQAGSDLAREVQERFEAYLKALCDLSNLPYDTVEVVSDPLQLSYNVASMLPLPLEEKQRLLELPSVDERLAAESRILERETRHLEAFSAQTRDKGYFYFKGKRFSMN